MRVGEWWALFAQWWNYQRWSVFLNDYVIMLQMTMAPSVLTWTAVLWREFQKIIWSTSSCPQLLRDFVQWRREWEEKVPLVNTELLGLCCLIHPALLAVTQPLCMYPRAQPSGISALLVAISNNLVLNLRRENGCRQIMTLTTLSLRSHPCLCPFPPPLLSSLWIRLIGLKFRRWLDCFGVHCFAQESVPLSLR